MTRFALLAATALSATAALAQVAPAPAPAPAAPVAPAPAANLLGADEAEEPPKILENGSFEWPAMVGRRERSQGADVSKSTMSSEWLTFKDKPDADGGKLILGLTSQIARSGRQSLFVEFNQLTKPNVSTELSSDLLPIMPDKPYRISIWGRMDKERPITLAQRSPYLKLRIDWFKTTVETNEDGEKIEDREQTGEVTWKAQPIPGPKNRKPLFVAHEWNEYFANVKSPEDANFIKITWYWDTPPQEGETDGVIYFDDATIQGEPGPKEDPSAEIEAEEKAAEAAKAAASTPATPGAAPAAPTPPAK